MRRILAFLLLLVAISGTVGAEQTLTAKSCSTVPEDMGYCLFDKDGKRVSIVYFPHVLSGQMDQLRRELALLKQENLKLRQQFQDNKKAVANQITKAQEDTKASLEEAQKKNDSAFQEMGEKLTAQQEKIETNQQAFAAQMASLGGRNVLSLALGGIGILGMYVIGMLAYSNRKQSKTIHTELTSFVALIKERIENEDRGKQDPPRPPKGNGRTGNTQPIDTRKVAEAKQKAEVAALVISGEPLSLPSGDATLVGSENLILIHDDEAPEEASAPAEPSAGTDPAGEETRVGNLRVASPNEGDLENVDSILSRSGAWKHQPDLEVVEEPSTSMTPVKKGMLSRLGSLLSRDPAQTVREPRVAVSGR